MEENLQESIEQAIARIGMVEKAPRYFPEKEIRFLLKYQKESQDQIFEAVQQWLDSKGTLEDFDGFFLLFVLAQMREHRLLQPIMEALQEDEEVIDALFGMELSDSLSTVLYTIAEPEDYGLFMDYLMNSKNFLWARAMMNTILHGLTLSGKLPVEEYLRVIHEWLPQEQELEMLEFMSWDLKTLGSVTSVPIVEEVRKKHPELEYEMGNILPHLTKKEVVILKKDQRKWRKYWMIDDVVERLRQWACFEKPEEKKEQEKQLSYSQRKKVLKKLKKK